MANKKTCCEYTVSNLGKEEKEGSEPSAYQNSNIFLEMLNFLSFIYLLSRTNMIILPPIRRKASTFWNVMGTLSAIVVLSSLNMLVS